MCVLKTNLIVNVARRCLKVDVLNEGGQRRLKIKL